jgi:hypothetical protein
LPPQVRRPTRPRLQPKRQADPCCRGIANASAKIANCFAAVPDDRARLFRRLWNVGDGSLADACPRICDVRFVLASNLLAIGWRTGSPPKPSSTPSRNGERVFQLLSAAMSPLASKASEHHSQTRKIRFQSRFRLWAIRTMLAQSHLTGAHMNASIISAPSAPLGAAIGGTASFLASRMTQRMQMRAQWLIQERLRRQELYKDSSRERRNVISTRFSTTKATGLSRGI